MRLGIYTRLAIIWGNMVHVIYHSMLNNVVHNSPLANQVSVSYFWHPPELQNIYPIRCKLPTCCYGEYSCYSSVLWLSWTDQWLVWIQYHQICHAVVVAMTITATVQSLPFHNINHSTSVAMSTQSYLIQE